LPDNTAHGANVADEGSQVGSGVSRGPIAGVTLPSWCRTARLTTTRWVTARRYPPRALQVR